MIHGVRVAERMVTQGARLVSGLLGFTLLLEFHSTSLFPRATVFMKRPSGAGKVKALPFRCHLTICIIWALHS